MTAGGVSGMLRCALSAAVQLAFRPPFCRPFRPRRRNSAIISAAHFSIYSWAAAISTMRPRRRPASIAAARRPATQEEGAAEGRRLRPRPAPVIAPEEKVVQKLDNAQKIMVVGDFLAGGLGSGMDAAFK